MTHRDRMGTGPCGAVLAAAWWGVASLLPPFLRLNLRRRLTRGRETSDSVPQRRGIASLASRPPGPLIWLHAASVGESVALLPVISQLLAISPTHTILVTTGTVTGAGIMQARLPGLHGHERVIQQFAPLDVPRWVARFLDFWRPDVAALVESELWPNLIASCRRRHIPLALLNGRLSDRSLARWGMARCLLARILSAFSWVMARSPEDAQRLRLGGAARIDLVADLKEAAPALPYDPSALDEIHHHLAGRPVWVAASTHRGEEAGILAASHLVRHTVPDALTIIIPRHPERGTEIETLAGHPLPRRAEGQFPTDHDAVWICDTLGETGLFYALGAPVLMGNSLPGCAGGGHNPAEPAHAGCTIASGPQTGNFRQAYARMGTRVHYVRTAQDIAQWVIAHMGQRGSDNTVPTVASPSDPDIARQVAGAIVAMAGR
ncbi:3-deoxy-D-manno-octulosonic acid transferase [Komagataeibacter oboediens]|uniref:3-deoxy-D-manno-octulosonic acid transferase n=2 Tax=Komagataeibacter oboediens TaxID=65958 RepID=UPI001C2CA0C3|nr:glycosyltransferase N-terminal domain-containing protein [Komagataeibacter oboediens]MBV0887318.1 3-deoxy-D-manno-octulosonic acid transferase [Komagataeibacter oboediens]MCK9818853.1 3-deoxy-D-manno-octulosonic acid transferase [Komagataeibacter oboediens]